MSGIVSLMVLAVVIVIIGVIGIVATLMNGKKDTQPAARPARQLQNGLKSWRVHIVVALVLFLWSIVAVLFYLAVVWILRQNPDPNSNSTIGESEKKAARRVYMWLFFSSIITVPIFLAVVYSGYTGDSTANEHVLQALVPLIFHLPLLAGLTSKSTFVYRHTQQGILLIALRAAVANVAISMGDYPDDGLWLFLLGNGSLWLFGSFWGAAQVNRGACWWMTQKGERNLPASATMPEVEAPMGSDVQTPVSMTPEKYLEYSKWYLRRDRKDTSKAYALEAFRHGDPEIRLQAIHMLDDLNEVEYF